MIESLQKIMPKGKTRHVKKLIYSLRNNTQKIINKDIIYVLVLWFEY